MTWIVTTAWYYDRKGTIKPATDEKFSSKKEAESKRAVLEGYFASSGRVFEVREIKDEPRS